MKSKRYFCLLIVAGCSRAPSPELPAPEPGVRQPPPVIVPDSRPANWTFTPASSSRSYIAVESTTVMLDSRRDSSVARTAFTVAVSPLDTHATVRGTIEQITAEAETPIKDLPFSFSGVLQNGGLTIDSIRNAKLPTVLMCDTPALSRLSVIRRNILATPSTLTRNQTWTDSSTVPACSGTIPVQVTSVRTYRVVGEADGGVVLERQDRVVASGEGAQGQHRITLQSRGTGSSRFLLDRITGALISASGSTQLQVDIGSSGRVQRFVQVVRDRVLAR